MRRLLTTVLVLVCVVELTVAAADAGHAARLTVPAVLARNAAYAGPQIRRYPLPSDGQAEAIYGNLVAWSRPTGPKCHAAPCTEEANLYLAKLSNLHPTFVRNVGFVGILTVKLSARWVVWFSAPYLRPGWSLGAHNVQTGATRMIDRSTGEGGAGAPPAYPSIALAGDSLLWTRKHCIQGCTAPGASDAQIENLVSGARQTVATDRDPCSFLEAVSITPTTPTWKRSTLTGYGCPEQHPISLVTFERSTGLTTSRPLAAPPGSTGGHFHLWTQVAGTRRGVRIMDLRTNRTVTLCRSGCQAPETNGEIVVWRVESRHGTGYDVFDLHTWRSVPLERDIDNGKVYMSSRRPILGTGRRLVWDEIQYRSTTNTRTLRLVVADVP